MPISAPMVTADLGDSHRGYALAADANYLNPAVSRALSAVNSGLYNLWQAMTIDVDQPRSPVRRTRVTNSARVATQREAKHDQTPESGDTSENGEVTKLVERAQAGDADAFGSIYDRYNETVFRYIFFRVNNRQLAEDLTSETFLRALRRISSFSWQGRAFGAWLVTIARNLVVDHYKSGRYRLEVAKPDVLDANDVDSDPITSPEAATLDKLTNVTLLTAVKKLNHDQQECIVLRFLQGFTVAETARAMGKNEGAIKALQYRAVRTLARLLPEGFTR